MMTPESGVRKRCRSRPLHANRLKSTVCTWLRQRLTRRACAPISTAIETGMPRVADNRQHDADRASDTERLRALEDRLARARGEPGTAAPEGDKYRQANQAWRMVIELVAGLGIGFGIGLGLDRLLGTTPILLVVFILLGFVAGVKTMLRTAAEMAGPAGEKPGNPAGNTPDIPAGNKPDHPARNTPDTPADNKPEHPAGNMPEHPAGTKGTQRGD